MDRTLWTRRVGVAVASAAAAVLLAAASCGGPVDAPSAPTGPGAAAAPTGGPIPAGLTDPCALLTVDEINAISGGVVGAGVRDSEEDGTYVTCRWYTTDDRLKIAATVEVTLFVVNDEMKRNVASDISSGKGDRLPAVGADTEVQAADLGVTGNSYAAGWTKSVFYRLQCHSPANGGRASKAICTDAVTKVAGRLSAK